MEPRWERLGMRVPMFAIMPLCVDTGLKLIPSSHKPGGSRTQMSVKDFEKLDEAAQVQYMDSIAILVRPRIGELLIVDGRVLN